MVLKYNHSFFQFSTAKCFAEHDVKNIAAILFQWKNETKYAVVKIYLFINNW